MTEQNDTDVDSLLDSLNEDLTNLDQSEMAESAQESSSEQDTGELGLGQEELSSSKKKKGEKKPWVDYVPEFEHKLADNLLDRLAEELDNLSDRLEEKEKLRLTYSAKENGVRIHRAYYQNWVRDGNKIYKASVLVKRRRQGLKDGKKPKES